MVRTRAQHEDIPLFSEAERVQGTFKMWMLPDLRVLPLKDLHFRWLIENRLLLRREFGLRMPPFTEADEQKARRWALRRGLVRLCYYVNGARLVVEADSGTWNEQKQAKVNLVVKRNKQEVDDVEVRLLQDA